MALTVGCILRDRNIGAVSNLGVRSSCEKCISLAVIVIISRYVGKQSYRHMHGCLYDWFRTYLDQSRTHPMRYVLHVLRSTMRATRVSTKLEAVLVSQEQLASRYVSATEGRKGAAFKYH